METARKLSAHLILTPQGWLQDGILSFDAEGRLLRIERTDRIDAQQNVEFYNGALVPGFVNAHCHLELSYLKGRIARGGGLAAFADAIASERGRPLPRTAAAPLLDCRWIPRRRDGRRRHRQPHLDFSAEAEKPRPLP